MTEPLISVANVSKTFISGSIPVQALKAVSLEINEGDFLVITGKSGAGITDRPN